MASRADTLYIEHVFKASEFSPTLAACMTLDLVESCKHFISAVINGSDLVLHFQLPLLMIFTLRSQHLCG
uniref:Uncharacterized protein n=1 Tax=Populus trichocarpa TaxID=3694 RepID=A0A2K1Y480_POPTR